MLMQKGGDKGHGNGDKRGDKGHGNGDKRGDGDKGHGNAKAPSATKLKRKVSDMDEALGAVSRAIDDVLGGSENLGVASSRCRGVQGTEPAALTYCSQASLTLVSNLREMRRELEWRRADVYEEYCVAMRPRWSGWKRGQQARRVQARATPPPGPAPAAPEEAVEPPEEPEEVCEWC